MNTQYRVLLSISALALGSTLHAQLVSDGATATLVNVTTNITGTVTVGTNGSFTLLVLSDNTLLTNTANGNIGLNPTARSNEVRLISSTARWRMGGTLFVGSNGALSRLVISNGAFVESGAASFAFRLESSNNTALVTDPGSIWSTRFGLDIGGLGRGNTLIVSNGGSVYSRSARLGVDATSSSNFALVSGVGSVWSNGLSLSVGNIAPGNRLVIEAGGLVISETGVVGDFNSASNNEALVTGVGSLWTNSSGLIIGSQMPFNRLVVSNGAAVRSGSGALKTSNNLVVTGSGSIWSNATTLFLQGTANVTSGGWLACGDGYVDGTSNAVVLGGASGWNNLGALRVGDFANGTMLIATNGATVLSSNALIGSSTSLGNDNLVLLSGAGTVWSNQNDFTVGNFGFGNRLVLSNGAALFSRRASVGNSNSANNNEVLVTGPGSVWKNHGPDAFNDIFVGNAGYGNRLTVSDGGRVESDLSAIGWEFSGSNNEAIVTGSGSLWTNESRLSVGSLGGGNRLVVTNGGAASAPLIILGDISVSTNNRIIVDGGSLIATNVAGSGTLDVRHGTNVFNAGLMDLDQLLVINPGGSFSTNFSSTGGSINIPTAGTATPYPSTIPVAGFSGNTTKVTVYFYALTHSFPDDLDIVLYGPLGQRVMLMSDAGSQSPANAITNVYLVFDDNAPSLLPDNTTIVAAAYRPTDYEPGETLPNPAPPGPYSTSLSSFNGSSPNGNWSLYINDDSNPDSGKLNGWGLSITTDADPTRAGVFEFNGGKLITRGAVISNDMPFVVGTTGSTPAVWDVRNGVTNTVVASDFIIGSSSSFNQLILTNGALLTNSTFAMLGRNFGANSNSATLAGAGSRWWLDDGVTIGNFGSGNRLVVSNGAALVTGSSSILGNQSTSSNNEAVVTGSGTIWNSSAFVFVGGGGRDNRLLISDGAQVLSWYGNIGNAIANASNNLALVTGSGSTWSNAFELRVGDVGPANQLVVSNGGTVFAGNAIYEGYTASALNSHVTVDGGTLRVTNAAATGLLDVRRGFFTLTSGLLDADRILATNSAVTFNFNGGTISARSSSFAIAPDVGNYGSVPATYFLDGNGTHDLPGLVVRANGTLAGNGTINGIIVTDAVLPLGVISPGASIGKIVLNNSPILNGLAFMEISKNGSTLTNDQIQVNAPLQYRGTLTVTNLGPTPLAAGDKFRLFPATSYSGGFVTMNLPPLPAGLGWTNKLLMDGSIEVVTASTLQPNFSGISLSGTNVILSGTNGIAGQDYAVLTATNLTTPPSNWVSLLTNQFGVGGVFSFTNGITPGEIQRYFQIRTP